MDIKFKDDFIRRKWTVKDDVVISGISGRFPKSESVQEFQDNLFNSINMMNHETDRFPVGKVGFPLANGQVDNLNKFDSKFFNIKDFQANLMDPQLRKLLEVSYESIIDSGLDIESLRGSNTGFFYGSSFQETEMAWGEQPLELPAFKQIYTTLLSYAYDLKGPIAHFDTACGSSFAALNEAFVAIKTGVCDRAFVAGYNICLAPFVTLQFCDLHMVSHSGRSKSLDAGADGYGRSEAVCCIILQKSSEAKRVYSTIVNCRSNTDGYKDQGINFPSVNLQRQLMYETFAEVNLNPKQVDYIEAHTTGTQAGDPVELKAIHDIFCLDRDPSNPLLIGSVKSNMGHAESASGLCATIKANLIFQTGLIPRNLHYENPNPNIEGLMNKTMAPVTTVTPFKGTYISLNCFGFGGSNVHVILKNNEKRLTTQSFDIVSPELPRLINICGRDSSNVEFIQNYLENSGSKLTREFLALFDQFSKTRNMPSRGYTLIKAKNGKFTFDHKVGLSTMSDLHVKRPLYVTFTNDLVTVDKSFSEIQVFKQTINRLEDHLSGFNIALNKLSYGDSIDPSDCVESLVTSTAVQIGLINVLRSLNLKPDAVLGHSTGQLICAYANGLITEEQTILTAYWLGKLLQTDKSLNTLTVTVNASLEKVSRLCSRSIECLEKSENSCNVTGSYSEIYTLLVNAQLADIPVNWPSNTENGSSMANLVKNITSLTEKLREKRSADSPNGSFAILRNFFISQIISSDCFVKTLRNIDSDSVFVELGPSVVPCQFNLTESVMRIGLLDDVSSCVITVDRFIESLGQLYAEAGYNYALELLYPKVAFPVAGDTMSLHSLIKWDHSADWKVFKYPEFFNPFKSITSLNLKVNLANAEDWFLSDHKIDGRILYPATGLLMLAWYTATQFHRVPATRLPVKFRDVRLIRATVLPTETEVKFVVQYLPYNGSFNIIESGQPVASGKIFVCENLESTKEAFTSRTIAENSDTSDHLIIDNQDIYKELRVRGYDYGASFRCLSSADSCGSWGVVNWKDPKNIQLKSSSIFDKLQDRVMRFFKTWITFTDSALQLILLANRYHRELFIPTGFEQLICDPEAILNTINAHNRALEVERAKKVNETTSNESEAQTQSQEESYPEFHVTHDKITRTLVTNGLWVKGLLAADASRKHQHVTLESYKFVSFNETDAIDSETEERLSLYRKLCIELISSLRNQIVLKISVPETEIAALETSFDLKCDEYSLGLLLTQMAKGVTPNNEILSKLSSDLLIGSDNVLHNHIRFIWPFINTAAAHEAFSGDISSKFNIIEVHEGKHFLCSTIKSLLDTNTIGTMRVNYTVVRQSQPDQAISDSLTGYASLVTWDLSSESKVPSSIERSDLIIYRVSNGSLDVFSQSLDSLNQIMKPEGHLLILSREKWTNSPINGESGPVLGNILKDKLPTTLNVQSLIDLMSSRGWTLISQRTLSSSMLPLYGLMFKKRPETLKPRKNKIIQINPMEYSWVDDLKTILSEDNDSLIWLVSSSNTDQCVMGLSKCLSLEANGSRVRCIANRPGTQGLDLNAVDFSVEPFSELLDRDCKFNIYDGKFGWGDYCHFELPSKVEQDKKNQAYVKDAYVQCLVPGDLSSLVWTEFAQDLKLSEGEFLVDVHYAPLNFKDIMHATGRLPSNLNADWSSIPNMSTPIGLEYAGRDANGNRIMGMLPHRALATKVKVGKYDFVWPIPKEWSLEDAATVPVVYATAIYALLIRGNLRNGETILIQAGSGGVGFAAINIALSKGCRVFTTVGSQEKRSFLQKMFPILDDSCFANSRDTSFEEHILRQTNGHGVDVVLNSLAEDKLQASLRCLAPGGRFLEIGKYDFVQNNKINLGLLDEGRTFHGIMLDAFFTVNSTEIETKNFWEREKKRIDACMIQGIQNGIIKPLPRQVFSKNQVETAFRFMASGKHIGKVLIKVREDEEFEQVTDSVNNQVPKPIRALKGLKLSSEKIYLIIGGFGGFGLELALWLVKKGARHLILNSRTGPKSKYHKYCVDRMREAGTTVHISNHDMTNMEACCDLISSLLPRQFGGIFNCALVLNDALITDQTSETFEKVCSSKVKVTRNLDSISRSLCPELDYFVVFSSVACGRGNPGQTNYGLANNFMESVCERRTADGLHGLAIQWGFVGDVGFVVEKLGTEIDSIRGTAAQRIYSCFSTLERCLTHPEPILSSLVRAADRRTLPTDSGDIIKAISHILGIKDIYSQDPNTTLGELGMDSLMAIEVQQALERQFNLSISSREIRALKISNLIELSKKFKNGKTVSTEATKNSDAAHDNIFDASIAFLKVPTEQTIKLNDISSGEPIYYVPPLEGSYDLLKGLAERSERPAIGLNWTYNLVSFKTLEESGKWFADYLCKIHRTGSDIQMIGYSFGGLLSLAIATELEKRSNGPKMSRLILLDADPETLKHAAANLIHSQASEDLAVQEIEFLKGSLRRVCVNLDVNSIESELQIASNLKERLKKFEEIMVKHGINPETADNITKLNELTLQKGRMTLQFNPHPEQVACKIIHIRAKDDLPMIKKIENGAKFGEEHFFNGNHHTLISSNREAIEKIIKDFFENNNNLMNDPGS